MVRIVNHSQIPTVAEAVTNKKKIPKIKKSKDGKASKIAKGAKKFWSGFMDRWRHYCTITSLHGWRHMVRTDFSKWERVVWSILCFLSIIIALVLLWLSLSISGETPTVTVIESTHHPTWAIPFPGVTLCNLNKIDSVNLGKALDELKIPNGMDRNDTINAINLLMHFNGESNASVNAYLKLDNVVRLNNLNIPQFFERISPQCNEMMLKCLWKGGQVRCDHIFTQVFTYRGICCSFNSLNLRMLETTRENSEPRRVSACGFQTGLTVLVNPFIERYSSSSFNTYGFRVMINDAYDIPDDNSETKIVESGVEAFISVTPEETYSTDEVLKQELSLRHCYAADEIQLETTKKYSYNNCLNECRRKVLLNACNCTSFLFPRNGKEQICGVQHLPCIQKMKKYYGAAVIEANVTLEMLAKPSVVKGASCNCLPDCRLFSYFTEISTGIMNRKYSIASQSFFQGITLTNHSIIHVFYSDLVSTRYRKDMFQNWQNVLAMFGGLTGLFLGFSLVSGYEVVYYFSGRILFDEWMAFKKRREVKPKEVEVSEWRFHRDM